VLTDKIGFDQVEAKNLNPDVAGIGLTQSASGALDVDLSLVVSSVNGETGAVNISTDKSIIGNGVLSDIELVNDQSLPGSNKYYGTDDSGAKGYHSASSLTGGGTISSNDLTVIGGANAAFEDVTIAIADDAVTASKIADEAVTPAKLEDGTADGQILQWDATASSWERVTMPTIYAAGKVDGTGTVGFDSEYTVSGNTLGVEREGAGPGSYLISWNTALPDNNYIIQLSIPSSGGTGNDDFDISYRNQSIIGFIVEVGDNDNGGSNRDPRDSEFMFTVIKLPN
jgi:hypothetical protein